MQFDENNNVLEKEISRAILVGASLGPDISYSMNELEGLAIADDIVVLGQMVQNVDRINAGTYIGTGKVEELKQLCENMDADLIVFNDELSSLLNRNGRRRQNASVVHVVTAVQVDRADAERRSIRNGNLGSQCVLQVVPVSKIQLAFIDLDLAAGNSDTIALVSILHNHLAGAILGEAATVPPKTTVWILRIKFIIKRIVENDAVRADAATGQEDGTRLRRIIENGIVIPRIERDGFADVVCPVRRGVVPAGPFASRPVKGTGVRRHAQSRDDSDGRSNGALFFHGSSSFCIWWCSVNSMRKVK